MKVQQFMAFLGGMLKLMLLMGRFIVKPYAVMAMNINLLDHLFYYQNLEDCRQQASKGPGGSSGKSQQRSVQPSQHRKSPVLQ